jgi:hypothetical protein
MHFTRARLLSIIRTSARSKLDIMRISNPFISSTLIASARVEQRNHLMGFKTGREARLSKDHLLRLLVKIGK